MEKQNDIPTDSSCQAYACFEEPSTLNILNFLELEETRVTYKGAPEDQGRKQKHFPFHSISFLTDKLVPLSIIDSDIHMLP